MKVGEKNKRSLVHLVSNLTPQSLAEMFKVQSSFVKRATDACSMCTEVVTNISITAIQHACPVINDNDDRRLCEVQFPELFHICLHDCKQSGEHNSFSGTAV